MNQILFNAVEEKVSSNSLIKRKNKTLFSILFIISICLLVICLLYSIFQFYESYKNEQLSNRLLDNYSVISLYSNSSNSDVSDTSLAVNESPIYSIIGKIQIDTIHISYPILSHTNDTLLKIAPCKFYGPSLNSPGNVCIAAHNYNNNKFFSKIHILQAGDSIHIYDLNNNLFEYIVYQVNEVPSNDTSSLSQDTNGKREITLITCNNTNKNRIIVKAKQKS